MKIKLNLLVLLIATMAGISSFGQEIPLVYDIENTGSSYLKPILPTLSDLPTVEPFTDPFEWSDGSGRDTTFASWSHRRAEIKAEIENYEIGVKPDRPDTITASYSKGILTVNVTKNGQTLTLTSPITLPEGEGPFPAVIGMNFGTGSLPASIFTSRKIATIAFVHDQVVTYGKKQQSDPYYKLYPDLFYTGQYSSWIWGISRLIDGLELVQDSLPIDLKHLAVTGCSYAGKMALFAGAFDERIALTIAQESGGGGAAAWRYSETLGPVETLGATDHKWFMESMFQFAGSKVTKLPYDHHELMAMVAPRALLVLGNPDYVWLADESGYVSCRAAQRVWENFGIPDRFGFSYVAGHMHCSLPTSQYPEVEAFVDKFLLNDTTANTNVAINPYSTVDYSSWTYWWGKETPFFPLRSGESTWLEPECAIIGKNWKTSNSTAASNGKYVGIKTGFNSTTEAPVDSSSNIYIPFTVPSDSTYHLFFRTYGENVNNDSYWIKIDDGNYELADGLTATAWMWKKINSYKLKAGKHTLTIAYCEDGAKLDKICFSDNPSFPILKGDSAGDICNPITVDANITKSINGFSLEQNYPNPVNDKTTIAFEIPKATYVSLKVYNSLGAEIAELAGKEYLQGKHTVVFDTKSLSKGIYFYTMKANNFSASQKMILDGK